MRLVLRLLLQYCVLVRDLILIWHKNTAFTVACNSNRRPNTRPKFVHKTVRCCLVSDTVNYFVDKYSTRISAAELACLVERVTAQICLRQTRSFRLFSKHFRMISSVELHSTGHNNYCLTVSAIVRFQFSSVIIGWWRSCYEISSLVLHSLNICVFGCFKDCSLTNLADF